MNKQLTFILSLTFLFLFSGSSVVFGDDFQDATDAYNRKDYETAYKLFLPLAEKGDVRAQTDLGLMYYNGRGVKQDKKEAFKWMSLAAEQGHPDAQVKLGNMSEDKDEAVKWFRLAAEQGDADGQYFLGFRYYMGAGVPKDKKEATKWYRLAAKQGHADARKVLDYWGDDYEFEKSNVSADDYQDALDAYKRRDYKIARRLLLPLAKQGNAKAQFKLGSMYYEGYGVGQDYKEAVKWFRLAAEQGLAEAQSSLGYRYYFGNGVPQNFKEAEKWWRLSAEQGNADAQFDLGLMYGRGDGVPQDYKQAVKWFRLAAEQGIAQAQEVVGMMYYHGQGVPKDYVSAHMWVNLAASNGEEHAIEERNMMEKEMTPSQIEKAQELVRNWKPSGSIRIAESPPPQPSTPQPPKSSDAIAAGTGFLFGSRDYIVTNYHVVKGTSQVKVKFLNEEIFDAQVIAKDIQNDVAILKLNKTPSLQSIEMKFGDSSMVRMGDKVFTIGYPSTQILGTKPKYSEGVISAVTGIQDNPTMFQTTVPILPGSSGSPLFNENGEVIGLTTGSLSSIASDLMGSVPHNINYAIKSSFVKNIIGTVPDSLFSNRGIVVVPTDSHSRSDFIEAISKNVVLVLGKVD